MSTVRVTLRALALFILAVTANLVSIPPVSAEELIGTQVPLGGTRSDTQENARAVEQKALSAEATEISAEVQKPEVGELNQAKNYLGPRDRNIMHTNYVTEKIAKNITEAIIAVLSTASVCLLIGFIFFLRHKRKQEHEQFVSGNIEKLLAAGRDIPTELLQLDSAQESWKLDNTEHYFRKGVNEICLGVGILIFLSLIAGFTVGAVAFILIAMGISKVIIAKKSNSKVSPTPNSES